MDDTLIIMTASLERFLAHLLGPDTLQPAMAAAIVLLLLTILANFVLAIVFRARRRRKGAQPSEAIGHHVYSALEMPVHALITLYGLYLVLVPLVLQAPDSQG